MKKRLAEDGIEYYEPEINLVIGKNPSIHKKQWRRLLADNQNGFRLLTYDKLLIDAAQRLEDMIRVMP